MSGRARHGTETSKAWPVLLTLLGALALEPGCGCGGWTGGFCASDSAEGRALDCSYEAIDYDESSVQGISAKQLVAEHAATLAGNSTDVTEGFWDSVGLEPKSSPVPLELAVSYADGEVLENACTPELTVAVELTVRLGDDLVEWQAPATLELVSGTTRLTALLPAREGGTRVDLELTVDFSGETATAELSRVGGPDYAWADFVLQ